MDYVLSNCMCVCVFLSSLVALGNRGSPREVISVACESPWLSDHTYYIVYCVFFVEQIYISFHFISTQLYFQFWKMHGATPQVYNNT